MQQPMVYMKITAALDSDIVINVGLFKQPTFSGLKKPHPTANLSILKLSDILVSYH